MAFDVLTWNLEEGLALRERSALQVEAILRQDADVITLPDAYWLENPVHGAQEEVVEDARARFRSEGYSVFETDYNNASGYSPSWAGHCIVVASRLAVAHSGALPMGTRDALEITVEDPDTKNSARLIAAHLEHRYADLRDGQAWGLVSQINPAKAEAIIGDLNALHREAQVSKLFRSCAGRAIVKMLPGKYGDYAGWITHMAEGTTFAIFEGHGLRDADPCWQPSAPTNPPFRPFLHLDRCFTTPTLQPSNFRVIPARKKSDHDMGCVTLEAVA